MNEEHYRKAWEEMKQDAITQIQQIKENNEYEAARTCPKCGSRMIEYPEPVLWEDDDEISQECYCQECGTRFVQFYETILTKTTIIKLCSTPFTLMTFFRNARKLSKLTIQEKLIMNELIKEIQKVLSDYWESFQERDDAEYALREIENILTKYEKENN